MRMIQGTGSAQFSKLYQQTEEALSLFFRLFGRIFTEVLLQQNGREEHEAKGCTPTILLM